MYTLIGLGILFIAALVVAYLSSRHWHWGQVTVVFFLFLAAVGYGILAADVLRKHDQVRSEFNRVSEELDEMNLQNMALREGTRDSSLVGRLSSDEIQPEEGALVRLRDLERRLDDLLRARGPVWRFIGRTSPPDPQTGAIPIVARPPAQQPPDPLAPGAGQAPPPQAPPLAGLDEGTIVFAFEQTTPDAQALGQYLGEFQVTKRNGPQAVLTPVLRESWAWPPDAQVDERIARLRDSQLPWVLYDTMPADRHEAFAGLNDERLRELLPPESVEEYVRHGEPAGEEVDPQFRAPFTRDGIPLTEESLADTPPADVEWRYQRPLRDYGLLFQMRARERVEEITEHEALEADLQLLAEAQKDAASIRTNREQELQELKNELAGFTQEAEIMEQYAQAVRDRLQAVVNLLQQREQENGQLAGQLAEIHSRIMRRLNETVSASTN